MKVAKARLPKDQQELIRRFLDDRSQYLMTAYERCRDLARIDTTGTQAAQVKYYRNALSTVRWLKYQLGQPSAVR